MYYLIYRLRAALQCSGIPAGDRDIYPDLLAGRQFHVVHKNGNRVAVGLTELQCLCTKSDIVELGRRLKFELRHGAKTDFHMVDVVAPR